MFDWVLNAPLVYITIYDIENNVYQKLRVRGLALDLLGFQIHLVVLHLHF